jgi:flagellar basal-body rod modification protein FlgD
MDQQAFLKLLMAQLQYQDPLEPMDNTAFLSQTAQFNALSQQEQSNTALQSLLSLQSLTGGSDLIGKNVELKDPDTGLGVEGAVTSVVLREGGLSLVVQPQGTQVTKEYPLSAVVAVGQQSKN